MDGLAPSGWAAGRRRTPETRISADPRNVAASRASARYGPIVAMSAPPAAKPSICTAWLVMFCRAEPMTYASPSSTSGSSAARAAEKGALSSTTRKTSAHSAQNGTPGTAITPTSAALSRSQVTMTPRRANRSARPASSGPPTILGR